MGTYSSPMVCCRHIESRILGPSMRSVRSVRSAQAPQACWDLGGTRLYAASVGTDVGWMGITEEWLFDIGIVYGAFQIFLVDPAMNATQMQLTMFSTPASHFQAWRSSGEQSPAAPFATNRSFSFLRLWR